MMLEVANGPKSMRKIQKKTIKLGRIKSRH